MSTRARIFYTGIAFNYYNAASNADVILNKEFGKNQTPSFI